jgi:mannosyl-oligosaccharide glucosidase
MLGREIRSGAPPTSWPQSSSAANPPSQHLLLDTLLNRFEADEKLQEDQLESFKIFLEGIYENFKLNVEWFIRTQASDVLPNTFRWQGRTLTYCLTSGMDDYPRAPFLTTNEAHLDLQVWMIVSSRAISRVATILGKTTDADHYSQNVATFTEVM